MVRPQFRSCAMPAPILRDRAEAPCHVRNTCVTHAKQSEALAVPRANHGSAAHYGGAPPYARRHGKGVRPALKRLRNYPLRISGRNSAAMLPGKPPTSSQQIPLHADLSESTRSPAAFPCVVPCRRKPLPRRRRKDGHEVAGGAEGRGARARSWRRIHTSRRPRAARRLFPRRFRG